MRDFVVLKKNKNADGKTEQLTIPDILTVKLFPFGMHVELKERCSFVKACSDCSISDRSNKK